MDRRLWRAVRLIALGGLCMSAHELTIWAPAVVAIGALSYWALLELAVAGLPEGLIGALLMAIYANRLGLVEGFMIPSEVAIGAAAVLAAYHSRDLHPSAFWALTTLAYGGAALTLTSGAYWLVKHTGAIESVKAAASHLLDQGLSFALAAALMAVFRHLRTARR